MATTKKLAADERPLVTGWVIKIAQRGAPCAGVTRAGKDCTNHGDAGWGDGEERYCYAHHPHPHEYRAEKERIEEIVEAAVRAALPEARFRV